MLKKLGIVIPSAVLTLLMAVGFSTPASETGTAERFECFGD